MQFDKFTLKSQEAIQAAQQLAQDNSNQEIHPAHLVKAILVQPNGSVVPVLQKMGVDPSLILMGANRLIEQIPGSRAAAPDRFTPRRNSNGSSTPPLRLPLRCRTPMSARSTSSWP